MYGITANLPFSKRRRVRMDNHAAAQRQHRKKLKEHHAPDRENFAVAALTVCLLMVDNDRDNEVVAGMCKAILGELVRAGFNQEQVKLRFEAMVDRIHKDGEARQRIREWKAAREIQA